MTKIPSPRTDKKAKGRLVARRFIHSFIHSFIHHVSKAGLVLLVYKLKLDLETIIVQFWKLNKI
jgi:hypothetical protein